MLQTVIRKAGLLLFLALLVFQPHWLKASAETAGFDGGPLAVMLRDALEYFYSGDYQAVIELSSQALRAQVPQEIEYYHEHSWSMLRELAEYGLGIINGNNSIGREDLYRLYRLRLEATSILREYSDNLIHHIPNPPTRLLIKRTLYDYLDRLGEKIDELIRVYEERSELVALRLQVETPREALAGRSIELKLLLSEPVRVKEARIVLSTPRASFAETIEINSGEKPVTEYTLSFLVPGTETGAYNDYTTQCRLIVAVTGTTEENKTAYGATSRSLVVKAVRPRILFQIPARVGPGEVLVVRAQAQILRTLNVTLRLVNKTGGIVAEKNTTIQPGANVIELPVGNTSRGVYTLTINVWPQGEYLEAYYSKAVLIAGKPLKATISAPQILIGPPFTATIRVNVSSNIAEKGYWVYISSLDGMLLGLRGVRGEAQAALEIPLSWSLLFDSRELIVRVRPQSLDYDEALFRVRIYMFNYVTFLVVVAIALTVSSATAEGLTLLARPVNAKVVRRKKTSDPVVRLYYRLIEVLAIRYRPPKPSETLREYYYALTTVIGKGRTFWLKVFLALYEKYLYSSRKPFLRELRRAYREAIRWLK